MISLSRGTTRDRTNSRVTRRISAKSSAETWEAADAVEVTAAFLSGYDPGSAAPGRVAADNKTRYLAVTPIIVALT
jgi:hypothetical protein